MGSAVMSPHWHPGLRGLVGTALNFVLYAYYRLSGFLACALYISTAKYFCMPLKFRAPGKVSIVLNTHWAGVQARTQAINIH